jgi:hypothetical protein
MARLRRLDRSVGEDGSGAAEQGDEGWKSVPQLFPGNDPSDVAELVELATNDLKGRFGVSPARLDECKWILRGRRLWLHTMHEWFTFGRMLFGGFVWKSMPIPPQYSKKLHKN